MRKRTLAHLCVLVLVLFLPACDDSSFCDDHMDVVVDGGLVEAGPCWNNREDEDTFCVLHEVGDATEFTCVYDCSPGTEVSAITFTHVAGDQRIIIKDPC